MQYAPLINAWTKLACIHRSPPFPTKHSYSLLIPKLQIYLRKKSLFIYNDSNSEFYYRKIVYWKSSRKSSSRNREFLSLSSVTGSRGYTTRSHNAAARFRWTSRPNPRKTRLLSANWYRVLTQFRSGVGGPCRGGLSRVRVPPRGVLSLSLWHALLSTRALEIERGPSISLFTYIYIYIRLQSGCPLATDRDGFYDRPV